MFGPKNIGLYREDGLSYFEKKSGLELVKFKKNICKKRFEIFRQRSQQNVIEEKTLFGSTCRHLAVMLKQM